MFVLIAVPETVAPPAAAVVAPAAPSALADVALAARSPSVPTLTPSLVPTALVPVQPAAAKKDGETPVAIPVGRPMSALKRDETGRLKALHKRVRAGKAGGLPSDAKDYKYLLVPGFLWDAVEGYFEPNRDRLLSLGLDAEVVRTDPLGTPAENARTVRAAIEASDKRVVLLAHSKGGIDSLEALRGDPSLEGKVEALAAIQTPYYGTPVADFFRSHPLLRAASLAYARLLNPWRILAVNPFFRGATIDALSTAARSALSRDVAPETRGARLYTVASRVDDSTALKLLLWIGAGTVKSLTGRHNDGIVSPEDADIPGAKKAVLEHVGHIDTVSDPSSWKHKALGVRGHDPTFAADLTEAVVRWVLGS